MNPLRHLIAKREKGILAGIPSFCTANPLVLEAVMEQGLRHNFPILIEATANQVNQFGGYTGMRAADFRKLAMDIASTVGVDPGNIILGGDHLGPLVWKGEPSASAMDKAETLVRQFVAAGFGKIHLDTSMKLADDPVQGKLSTRTVAERGARLCRAALETFEEYQKSRSDADRPVFVIGSEVPIPGGEQSDTGELAVTTPEDFEETVAVYKQAFRDAGIETAWDEVVAVVVQPGVEFGDAIVHGYCREKARNLTAALKNHRGLVLEGHSTDYQSPRALREMTEDGIAIMKVGPHLTFAMREGLFALSMMEDELARTGSDTSNFIAVLERTMVEHPENWEKYYAGDSHQLALARKYSFSDRARYYLGEKPVLAAMDKLFANLSQVEIPANILHQYLPRRFQQVLDGEIKPTPKALVKAEIASVVDLFRCACLPEGI